MGRFPRIMVIDHEPVAREEVERLLSAEGYAATACAEAAEGLAELKKHPHQIVVVDPGGRREDEVVGEILEVNSDLAVIVFTSDPSVESAVLAFRAGALDYLEKPFDARAFGESVRRVIDLKGLLVSKEKKVNLTVGGRIREARKEQGLTIKQLARRANLSISLISQIERAESAASMATVYKISQALGLALEQVFKGL